MKDLQHKDLEGLEINIEWGKNSRHFDPEKAKRAPRDKERRADKSDVKCFKCDKKGHFARDCRERRYRRGSRSRSRSRSPRRDRERRDRYRSSRRSPSDSRSDERGVRSRGGDKEIGTETMTEEIVIETETLVRIDVEGE